MAGWALTYNSILEECAWEPGLSPVKGKNKNIFKQLQLLPGCHAQAHDDTANLVLADKLSRLRG